MNFDFKVRFSKQNFPTFLMMGFIFVSACSFEDFNSKIQSEKNETNESQMDQLEQFSKMKFQPSITALMKFRKNLKTTCI